jgi:hypothetical protein
MAAETRRQVTALYTFNCAVYHVLGAQIVVRSTALLSMNRALLYVLVNAAQQLVLHQ